MPDSSPRDLEAGRRPNLFILGAPRSGTTALYAYLSAHPSVFMSHPKEPLYWADDFPRANASSHTPLATLDDYLALFASAQPHHHVIGEATATYLFSRRAIGRIHAFAPEARYIVMLRNPVELVYSWHAELLYAYYEDEPDFRQAWALQAERAAGRRLPPDCLVPEFLRYEEVGRLSVQVRRLLDTVPRERIKFILFEDFSRNTGSVYAEVLSFLGLPDDDRQDFERINPSKRIRLAALGRLLFNPPPLVAPLVRAVRRLYSRSNPRLKTALGSLLRTEAPRSRLPEDLRTQLLEVFRGDIETLASLIDRDLSAWLGAQPRPKPESVARVVPLAFPTKGDDSAPRPARAQNDAAALDPVVSLSGRKRRAK